MGFIDMVQSFVRKHGMILLCLALVLMICHTLEADALCTPVSLATLAAASSIALFSRRPSSNALRSSYVQRAISENTSSSEVIHLVVLVHGWLGNDSELGYLEEALMKETEGSPNFVVYSARSNVGRTTDGVVAGGERLSNEIEELAKPFHERNASMSLSLVGNSLGGLYARYAISKLNMSKLEPFVFCTTATPHLGVSEHTYIAIPRWLEKTLAKTLKLTGMDLFCCTPIVEEMAREEKYIKPLSKFRKRISYANAFMTDFQVPATTAAFLSKNSRYPHVPVNDDSSFVALKVETPKNHTVQDDQCAAQSLDSLGWTKVFCDVRNEIPVPGVPLPSESTEDDLSDDQSSIPRRDSFTSQELIPLMSKSGNRWHLPLGHTVLVANSKSELIANINAKGRPIVDQLASDLVADIIDMEDSMMKRRTK